MQKNQLPAEKIPSFHIVIIIQILLFFKYYFPMTATDTTQDEKNLILVKDVPTTSLTEDDQTEVENTLKEAKDFRSLWEKITAPIDSIISETTKVIDADPIMRVSDELAQMNKEVQSVYEDIIDNDGMLMKILKSIPIIGSIASGIDAKWDEAKFNIKSLEDKIEAIFVGFDQAGTSLNTSIDMQKNFLEGIEMHLGKVVAYKDFLQEKIEDFAERWASVEDEDEKLKYDMFLRNVEYFLSNLVVLIGNLEMARKRLLMRLDSASKLSLAMSSSRPIFKTLLSTAVIETSSQKALDASMTAINTMWETIDKMSSELTDKAIESAERSEELSRKPVLSASVFVENVTKLKNHFDQIESFREQVKIEAEAEEKLFSDAKKQLEDVKVLSAKSQEELAEEINNG